MAITVRTIKLSVVAAGVALLSFVVAGSAAQQLLAALYRLQAHHYQQPPPRFAQAYASLQRADQLEPGNAENQLALAQLAQVEAQTLTGLSAWRTQRTAVRALESALRARPAWGQGWAHLALLRLTTADAATSLTAWQLGIALAPHEGLALAALCRTATGLGGMQAQIWRNLNCLHGKG